MTWFFASTLIGYHTNNKMKTTTHIGPNRLICPSKYILTPPVLCSQQLSVLHSMNNRKFTSQNSTMSWLFKNHWPVEVAYQLIRFNKINVFIWNTKNGKILKIQPILYEGWEFQLWTRLLISFSHGFQLSMGLHG